MEGGREGGREGREGGRERERLSEDREEKDYPTHLHVSDEGVPEIKVLHHLLVLEKHSHITLHALLIQRRVQPRPP